VSSLLQELIIERIEREGPLTFAEYMRLVLYEPGAGYYTSGEVRIGWNGDYITSADISALFAHCLGRQLLLCWEMLKRPVPFVVLEQGAGRNTLAESVRTWAEREESAFARALVYLATDIRNGQDSLCPADQSRAHVLFSNELLDAFPVHIVEVHEGQLFEVYVVYQQGQLAEWLAPPSAPRVASYLDEARIPWRTFPNGWRAEINLQALRWLEQAVGLLHAHGFLLTIDYGERARQLYTRERRRGTLLCYAHHQTSEYPLRLPGEQDITAHVDFSALITRGRALGLRLHRYSTQQAWLQACGLAEELARIRARDFAPADACRASDQGQVALLGWYTLRQRAGVLTDPGGMGNFKVLILRR
jgi:SAM-dependent MidA family methyltransferase